MRITKQIEVSTEVEAHVTVDDIIRELEVLDAEQRWVKIADGLNSCYQFMRSVSDEAIAAMNEAQRKTIHAGFTEQTNRFKP